MNEQDYHKVFEHFTDLSQRYALGKIQHADLYEGLKKLVGEIIDVELKAERRRQHKLIFLYLLLGLFIGGLAGWEYRLHQKHLPQISEKTAHRKGK